MSLALLATAAEGSSGGDSASHDPNQELDGSVPSEPFVRRKQRSKRACDKCSLSRARCSGEYPCSRCTEYGNMCSYIRQVKRRGRRRKGLQGHSASSQPSGMFAAPAIAPRTQTRNNAAQSPSMFEPNSLPNGRGSRDPMASNVQAGASPRQHDSGLAEHIDDGGRAIPDSGSTVDGRHTSPSNLHFNPHSLPRQQHPSADIPWSRTTTSSGIYTGGAVRHDRNEGDSPPSCDAASSNNYPTRPANTAHTPSQSDAPSFISIPDTTKTNTCRYPILIPLVSILADIIPISVACDLLEAYFDKPGSSLVEFGSPYVVTPVLRRRAILHHSHPRATSPALLLSMLHATAHTADISYFHVPGSRTIVCDKLYSTVVRQLDDPDDWHRLLNGRWLRLGGSEELTTELGRHTQDRGTGEPPSPNLSTDVLLAIILMTVVVSGGTFKADCLRWWNKALRLARILKFDELDGKDASDITNCSLWEIEAAEEKRRVFWLIFCLDRHLALSYNAPLAIHDAGISVYLPMPDSLWEDLDLQTMPIVYQRIYGPKTTVSGTDFFEYFLPLMAILGDIVLLHHRRLHPRFGVLGDIAETAAVESLLDESRRSVEQLEDTEADQAPTIHTHGPTSSARLRLVVAYSTHILHVLAVLLYGKWDPLEILRDPYTMSDGMNPINQDCDDWSIPARFMKCTSHAISASQTVATIVKMDPELVFMPYLFGIYLLHGSFILLLFADRMQQLGGPNPEVEQACETIIRAHEVCIATLSTEFQRSFRKMLRSTLYRVRGHGPSGLVETRDRKNTLEMYRWTKGGRGLAL